MPWNYRQALARITPPTNPKAQSDGNPDEVMIKQERKSIAEVRGILEQMNEQADEQLAADTSEAVQKRVAVMLDDWSRQHGVTLPDGSAASLAVRVGSLVSDAARVAGAAAGGD